MATLQAGSYVGSYEILAPIGSGGMGEVYRARDTKLKREVAIKVLPADWARDHERLARAQREAEVLAALNHPHIAQIYGREDAGGAPQAVADAANPVGGAWTADGVILFAPGSTGPLFRVPAGGGAPVEATRIEPPLQVSHRFPRFLPDGRHFVFFAAGTGQGQGIYIGALDTVEVRGLFDAAPDNQMMAVPVALKADGSNVEVGTPVALFPLRPGSEYSVTRDGQRFLINTLTENAATAPITVVLNWAGAKK